MIGLLVLCMLIVWLAAAIWIGRRATRLIPANARWRPVASVGLFVGIFLLPVADELAMRPWFILHCHEAATMKINAKAIRGKAVIVTVAPADGWLGGTLIPAYYSHFQYRDSVSGEVLAEYETYFGNGGLLSRSVGWNRPVTGSFSCAPDERETARERYQFTIVN
jgi:hypothetical protein